MRILLFLFLTVFISSCSQNTTHYQRDPKWILADEIYDNEIAKNVFLQLRKEKKLYVCESGWALRGKEKIRCMHCGFNYFDEITLDEARKTLVEAISLYLDAINKNERIRPLLNNYPFTAENIEIRIFLFTPKGGIPEPEKLHIISITEGKLRYEIGSLDPRAYLPVICEETYEEALNKLGSIAQSTEQARDLPRSEIFPPANGKTKPLQGKIVNGRYYAPKDVFSCQADDFGASTYLAQDILIDGQAMCVGFYSSIGDFKKAEAMFMRKSGDKILDGKALRYGFESFGIGILKEVDNDQGIEILREEMTDNMFFAAISIGKTSVLTSANGEHPSATRGYLVFQNKDKLVILSNQVVTTQGQKHIPQKHVERLKSEILEFKKTFEFAPTPAFERSI